MQKNHSEVIVIGSGPGGYRAAVLLALQGKNVAIVERQQWGGCCLNRGCVPKKAWHHTAKLIQASKRFAERGLHGTMQVNFLQAWQHQQRVVKQVRDSYENYLQRLGVKRYVGHGRLLDAHTVQVEHDTDPQLLSADFIILATGSTANYPEPYSLQQNKVIGTDELFDQPPPGGERVAIIGSGVVATEFAFILQQLGKNVFWYARRSPLSNTEFSQQAKRLLHEALQKSAVTETNLQLPVNLKINPNDVTLQFADASEQAVDWVLVATGRTPATSQLGLEKTAVQVDGAGFVVRNDFLQTAQENIYAIGDCTSPIMTANQALADATVVTSNILYGNHRQQSPQWVPQLIYSALELAKVGMNEDQAEDAGYEPAVGFSSFDSSPRALGQDDAEGFVRMLADMDSGEFLGAEIVGSEAGELIHKLLNAELQETILRDLAASPVNHPSRSEEITNAVETMAAKWGLAEKILAPVDK
ncbi:MAG: NAD(P)/FAD-dependent oxidoreductase [Gammaproteobacteria bacterium]|nr:NAD(P)/FAD-dependent oxidoreductase [Gammaproteobacteria bacterium]